MRRIYRFSKLDFPMSRAPARIYLAPVYPKTDCANAPRKPSNTAGLSVVMCGGCRPFLKRAWGIGLMESAYDAPLSDL